MRHLDCQVLVVPEPIFVTIYSTLSVLLILLLAPDVARFLRLGFIQTHSFDRSVVSWSFRSLQDLLLQLSRLFFYLKFLVQLGF